MINILLKNELKILMNTIRTQRWSRIFGFSLIVLILAGFVVWFGYFISSMSGNVTTPTFENMLAFGFLTVISMIVLMGISSVFKSLYTGSDLEMLFTMPIPTRSIFWTKYIQSYFGTPLLVFIIFAVPIISYGVAIQAHFLYYVITLIALFSMTIIGLSIIYLLNLLLIQIIPASRTNEFMTVMGIFSGIIVYLILVLPGMGSDEPVGEQVLLGLPAMPQWIPVSWGSTAAASAINGSLTAFLPLGALIILAVIMMICTTLLVERGFRTGWVRLGEKSSKKRSKKKKSGSLTKLNHPIIAIGKKEWYLVKRDLREWLTFLPTLFFIFFAIVAFFTSGADISDIRGFEDLTWPIAQGLLLFMYALSNGLISSSSIGREGTHLWITRVMPISGRQIAYGKFWISWLIPLLLVTVIEIIASFVLGWTIWQLFFGIVIKATVTLGISALGLWIGTLGAKYNPVNPQQRLNFIASFFLFISSYIYLIIALIPTVYLLIPEQLLEELPEMSEFHATGFFGAVSTLGLGALILKASHPVLMTIIGFIIILIVSIGATYLFLSLSARRIERGIKINVVSETSSRKFGRRKKKGDSLY